MKDTIAILGLGEVGTALRKIAEENGWNVLVRDVHEDELKKAQALCLHVCIPFKNEAFYATVKKAVSDCRPSFVVIHSTIPPGATEKLYRKIGLPVAHSPIRGNHPDLYKDIKRGFVKYVAGIDRKTTKKVMKHLAKIGIKNIKDAGRPINTELGKLINTFMYAWSIIMCKWADSLCDDLEADFDIVYTDFINTYNDGYKKSLPNVQQPVLRAVGGPIGGHCLIPNANLLKPFDKRGFTKFLLKENHLYKKQDSEVDQ